MSRFKFIFPDDESFAIKLSDKNEKSEHVFRHFSSSAERLVCDHSLTDGEYVIVCCREAFDFCSYNDAIVPDDTNCSIGDILFDGQCLLLCYDRVKRLTKPVWHIGKFEIDDEKVYKKACERVWTNKFRDNVASFALIVED